jgi:hypothetical protein
MSHHAKISSEAAQKLRNQKRNSTISAIIISLLSFALIVAILFYIALSPLFKNTEEMVTYNSGGENEEPITKPEMTNQVEKKPSSPASSMAKVIAATTPSATSIPVPDVTVVEPSLDFGDGNDFGDGWGSEGAGGGKRRLGQFVRQENHEFESRGGSRYIWIGAPAPRQSNRRDRQKFPKGSHRLCGRLWHV